MPLYGGSVGVCWCRGTDALRHSGRWCKSVLLWWLFLGDNVTSHNRHVKVHACVICALGCTARLHWCSCAGAGAHARYDCSLLSHCYACACERCECSRLRHVCGSMAQCELRVGNDCAAMRVCLRGCVSVLLSLLAGHIDHLDFSQVHG